MVKREAPVGPLRCPSQAIGIGAGPDGAGGRGLSLTDRVGWGWRRAQKDEADDWVPLVTAP